MSEYRRYACEVFEVEAAAIRRLASALGESFDEAIALMKGCRSQVVVSGMGKSGLVGRKITATLRSTGTRAVFLHPAEALHGDLGMLAEGDVFLSISSSGETDELLCLVPHLKRLSIPHITLTGRLDSTLARHADLVLDISVEREACPLQLAPTASAVAALAMGDALAMTLMQIRRFQPEDFARLHPGGSLGRKLLTTAGQAMRRERLPLLPPDAPMQEVVHQISDARLGLAVVERAGQIVGIITDGDVRRAMKRHEAAFFQLQAQDIMTPRPRIIPPSARLAEAEAMMRQHKITSLLVAEEGRLLGVLQIYDMG